MATIVWDPTVDPLDRLDRLHRSRRRSARCTGAPVVARAAARCRARNRRMAGVGVGVAVAGALALGLVPGSDAPDPAGPPTPMQPVSASSADTGADPEVGGTYRAIDRALAGSGDVSGLVAGLEGAAGE